MTSFLTGDLKFFTSVGNFHKGKKYFLLGMAWNRFCAKKNILDFLKIC